MKNSKYSPNIQKLYINAGQVIMDRLFSILSPYVRYGEFEPIINKTNSSHFNNKYAVDDRYCAFFHRLCCILSDSIYSSDVIYYILSPFHSNDVIYQMIIPDKNSFFINSSYFASCKVHHLYNTNNLDKYSSYTDIADELFKKSEKIQQETL